MGILRRGILKRQPQHQPFSGIRPGLRWPGCPRRVKGRQVAFQPDVRLTEFSRMLDGGGTVPGDGSLVTLGLGKPLRVKSVPLALARDARAERIEERVWVPPEQRSRLLRKAMGDARYFRAWARRRREVMRIKGSRRRSNDTMEHQQLMPSSLEEARRRAIALSKEVRRPAEPKRLLSIALPSERTAGQQKRKRDLRESPDSLQKQHKLRQCTPPLVVVPNTINRHELPAKSVPACNLCGISFTKEGHSDQWCACCILVPGNLGGSAAAGA